MKSTGDQRGALSISLLLALLAATAMGFGTWDIMRRWRQLTELQLRLDRCVGETALELKRTLQEIEALNGAIQALRAAAAASIHGGSAVYLPALQAAAAKQDAALAQWQARQAQWLMLRGCDRKDDFPIPLPSMSWFRPPPDALGPQPLSWAPSVPKKMVVRLHHPPRAAAATVEADGLMKGWSGENSWKAAWTGAELFRTGDD